MSRKEGVTREGKLFHFFYKLLYLVVTYLVIMLLIPKTFSRAHSTGEKEKGRRRLALPDDDSYSSSDESGAEVK